MNVSPPSEHSMNQGADVVDVEVLVLGAGVSGLAAAAGLLRAGIDDIVVIDRADGPGGTWRHNTYPGCAVDIPTHLYSFSWAPNPEWSRVFAGQAEVLAYLERCVESSGLVPHMRYGVELVAAAWDAEQQCWLVDTTAGSYRARHLVSGAGPLHEPQIPDLPGRDEFVGDSFHSAHWPADLDLTGRRVVVLGTGASALQFIPGIQPVVEHLTVLQRTPSWALPKPDWNTTRVEKALLRRFPVLMRLYRQAIWGVMDPLTQAAIMHPRLARAMGLLGRWNLRRSVKDPALRRILTPSYAPTCKRLGLSNHYYPALTQPNVDVVPAAAKRVLPNGVETVDGQVIEADVIIYGTGFHTLQTHPVNERIRGEDGVSLQQRWAGNPTAYMGTSVAGFPNFYCMFGPNAGTLSGFVMAEAQAEFVVSAVQAVRSNGWGSLDVTVSAEEQFTTRCDQIFSGSTMVNGGCSSYYLSASGQRVSLAWPGSMRDLSRTLSSFDETAFVSGERARQPS